MAQALGPNFDARVYDTPQARMTTLEGLLSQRTLKHAARQARVTVTDTKLRSLIASVPDFQQDGKFDYNLYKTLLTSKGRSEREFEAELRDDLARQTLVDGVSTSSFVPLAVADRMWQLKHQKRQVRVLEFRPDAFRDKVRIGDEAVRAEYEAHKAQHMTPETAKVEYLVLRAQDLVGQVSVTPADVRAFYDNNTKRWGEAERRRASHILFTAGAGGSAPDKEQARKLAETVLAKVKAGDDFAALAKKYSKDPGSAEKGGDLGWFGRGMMVKPFEQAAFSLKAGETSGIVESDFGFHIIRLAGIEPSRTKAFDEVRSQIESELAEQAAQKRFSEIAEQFSNFVYEQSDGLKAAADKFKLTVHELDGLTRRGPPQGEATAYFTPALLEAVFAPDSLDKHRNTKAIEVSANTLVSARVLDHHPASPLPFEVVRDSIRAGLERAAAADLAKKAGEQRLAELRKSPDDSGFGAPLWVGRDDPQQLPADAVNPVMGESPAHLPSYVGSGGTDGVYRVIEVAAVRDADPPAQGAQNAAQELERPTASAEQVDYVQALRQRYKARVSKAELASTAEK
jgi:peptidyl-prolyl cis-trans isomerase D